MANDVVEVQAFEANGQLTKEAPEPVAVTAFELDGRLFRTAYAAQEAKAFQAIILLVGSNPRGLTLGQVLANARAIADILTTFADATEK